MFTKFNCAVLTGATLLVSVVAPAFAQGSSDALSVDNTKVNIAQAGPRSGRIEARGSFAGGKMAWKGGHRHHHRSCGGGFHALKGDNALSSAQLEQLFTYKEQFLNQLGPKVSTLFSEKREMRDLLTQPNLDKSKVESLQASIDKTANEISDLKLNEQLNSISVLNDAQKKAIRDSYVKHTVFSRGGMRA